MLFNSFDFAIFLPLVFLIYWFVANRNLKLQNALLVVASYVFYGWWDWRFLSLIIFSSLTDFLVGRYMNKTDDNVKRRLLLFVSIFVNLGLLGFFKYFNFFVDSFVHAFTFLGVEFNAPTLRIILPVGISFYTFQTLSYTIDIYRRKIEPSNDIVAFFAFVSFFPQLVAGPIERAANLLPQFTHKRVFHLENAKDGMRQALWGLFKKVVIADTAAIFVENIFSNYGRFSGPELFIGAAFFSIQVYCDFSGYSDIAIGVSRLFGFKLMRNFSYPFFSRDIAEVWRRWHISLTTWFRDYLYIPLGGSKGGKWMQIRNIIIIFTISGFWHGAEWRFVIWGFLCGVVFIPLLLSGKHRMHLDTVAQNRMLPNLKEVYQMIVTFVIFTLPLIIFRADNMSHAYHYLERMVSTNPFVMPKLVLRDPMFLSLLSLMIIIEWFQRKKQHGLEIGNIPIYIRWPVYFILTGIILYYSVLYKEETPFIYFQF